VGGIAINPTPAVAATMVDNLITHNVVTGGAIFVGAGFDFSNPDRSFNGATVKRITVRDNTVSSAPGPGIEAFILVYEVRSL
jgi:hypothetical protein